MTITPPIWLALDTTEPDAAMELALSVAPHVRGVKLGLEFYTALGRAGVEQVAALGLPVFLDLKLHDIPNTVEKAVAAMVGLPVFMLTVHASGGLAMISRAVAASQHIAEVTGTARPLVIAVTLLTSLDEGDTEAIGYREGIETQAVRLARLAQDAGADGAVCSPREIAAIRRACGPEFVLVVPGIRPDGATTGDQKRTLSPKEALEAGAHHLVIGRPITAASNPVQAARAIAADLVGVLPPVCQTVWP
jgi:orotidine-5'-phosphate decarboxylase